MSRQARIVASLLVLACASSSAWADRKFNIHDDLLAFPQFQIHFPAGYVLDSRARILLDQASGDSTADERQTPSDQTTLSDGVYVATDGEPTENPRVSYEELILRDQRYLCQIPLVESKERNRTKEANEEDERKELARATDRGLELLREMEGKCLYYISGWWSYSFCYMNQIKQFHALPSGGGIPNYPPMEDPTTHSFILGRFPREDGGEHEHEQDGESETKPGKATTDVAELQTKGGSRYLVQHLEGGDQCDLTGRNRKIEVQFHCNPQSADRIGWIKELTTCSYLMLIYTPRLCHDIAFLPPQQDEVHPIECHEILAPDEVSGWEARRDYQLGQRLVESAETPEFPVVGDIQVGAQRLVGSEGKQIEKGRVAMAGEEKVDVVAKRVNGELQSLSKEELKKFDLDPEKIESLTKRLEELAKGKDWTLEMVTTNGERGLRGIVDAEDDSDEPTDDQAENPREAQDASSPPEPVKEAKHEEDSTSSGGDLEEGSEETFKDEL
ncbi:hypothetical protein ARAM_001790 [Aspergillus rambellii]|uniref:Endoplasmic reticulum lectin n=1 Tax=Aspergillus rambellii TaxID=308745 RepID=A0A0F8WEC6_9EURO|nr:hypothetical protein ARAM_001790 [Aspergillus rambellii]